MFNIISIVLFGLVLGSFSNVCIYRIPANISIVRPARSFCPWCHHQIRWYQNIPLLSFIWQRGRCAFCRSRISFRYFLVELLLPIFGIVFFMSQRSLTPGNMIFIGSILCLALVISFIDLDWRLIPDTLSLSWLIGALSLAPWNPVFKQLDIVNVYTQAIMGATMAASIVWATLFLGRIIKSRDVMGWGDVKLMACWGAVLGPWDGIIVFFVAAAFASLWICACLLYKKIRSNDFLPFGPFINLAGIFLLWLRLHNGMDFSSTQLLTRLIVTN